MPPGGALPWYAASSPLAGTAGPSGHCGRPAAPRPDHAWARAAGHGLGALHSLAPVPAHLAGARCFPDPEPPPPHRPGQPWPASPLRAWPWCLCAFLAPPTFLNRWEQPAQTYFLVFGIFHVVYLYIPISGRFLWHCLNANVHRLAVAPLTVDRVLFHGLVSPDGAHTCHVTDLLHRAAPLVAQGTCCSSPAPPTTPRRLPASLSPRTDGGHPFPRPYPHYPGALGPRTADQPVLEEGPTS